MKIESRMREMAPSQDARPDLLQQKLEGTQKKLEQYKALQEKNGFSDREMELWADSENPYRAAKFSRDDRQRLLEMTQKDQENPKSRQETAASKGTVEEGKHPEKPSPEIQSVKTFEELFSVLDKMEEVKGTDKTYEAVYLKNLISSMRQSPQSFSLNEITRAQGLRQKVDDLLKLEKLRQNL